MGKLHVASVRWWPKMSAAMPGAVTAPSVVSQYGARWTTTADATSTDGSTEVSDWYRVGLPPLLSVNAAVRGWISYRYRVESQSADDGPSEFTTWSEDAFFVEAIGQVHLLIDDDVSSSVSRRVWVDALHFRPLPATLPTVTEALGVASDVLVPSYSGQVIPTGVDGALVRVVGQMEFQALVPGLLEWQELGVNKFPSPDAYQGTWSRRAEVLQHGSMTWAPHVAGWDTPARTWFLDQMKFTPAPTVPIPEALDIAAESGITVLESTRWSGASWSGAALYAMLPPTNDTANAMPSETEPAVLKISLPGPGLLVWKEFRVNGYNWARNSALIKADQLTYEWTATRAGAGQLCQLDAIEFLSTGRPELALDADPALNLRFTQISGDKLISQEPQFGLNGGSTVLSRVGFGEAVATLTLTVPTSGVISLTANGQRPQFTVVGAEMPIYYFDTFAYPRQQRVFIAQTNPSGGEVSITVRFLSSSYSELDALSFSPQVPVFGAGEGLALENSEHWMAFYEVGQTSPWMIPIHKAKGTHHPVTLRPSLAGKVEVAWSEPQFDGWSSSFYVRKEKTYFLPPQSSLDLFQGYFDEGMSPVIYSLKWTPKTEPDLPEALGLPHLIWSIPLAQEYSLEPTDNHLYPIGVKFPQGGELEWLLPEGKHLELAAKSLGLIKFDARTPNGYHEEELPLFEWRDDFFSGMDELATGVSLTGPVILAGGTLQDNFRRLRPTLDEAADLAPGKVDWLVEEDAATTTGEWSDLASDHVDEIQVTNSLSCRVQGPVAVTFKWQLRMEYVRDGGLSSFLYVNDVAVSSRWVALDESWRTMRVELPAGAHVLSWRHPLYTDATLALDALDVQPLAAGLSWQSQLGGPDFPEVPLVLDIGKWNLVTRRGKPWLKYSGSPQGVDVWKSLRLINNEAMRLLFEAEALDKEGHSLATLPLRSYFGEYYQSRPLTEWWPATSQSQVVAFFFETGDDAGSVAAASEGEIGISRLGAWRASEVPLAEALDLPSGVDFSQTVGWMGLKAGPAGEDGFDDDVAISTDQTMMQGIASFDGYVLPRLADEPTIDLPLKISQGQTIQLNFPSAGVLPVLVKSLLFAQNRPEDSWLSWANFYGLGSNSSDADGDGLSNELEFVFGSSPLDPAAIGAYPELVYREIKALNALPERYYGWALQWESPLRTDSYYWRVETYETVITPPSWQFVTTEPYAEVLAGGRVRWYWPVVAEERSMGLYRVSAFPIH